MFCLISNQPFCLTANQRLIAFLPFYLNRFALPKVTVPIHRFPSPQINHFALLSSPQVHRFASPQINRFAFRSLLQIHRFASPQINHFDLLSLPQISYFALPQVTVQNPPCYHTSNQPFYRTTSNRSKMNRFAFLPQISRFALITTSNRSIPSSFPTLIVRSPIRRISLSSIAFPLTQMY